MIASILGVFSLDAWIGLDRAVHSIGSKGLANMSKTSEQIRDRARPLLDDDEEVLAALVASPRGSNTAAQLGVAGAIGNKWAGKHKDAADASGLEIHRNMVVALTRTRLLTMKVTISMMGAVKEVTEISSSLPISAVDTIESKWNVLTITIAGTPIKLEANPGRSKEFAGVFDDLKTAVA
jgi:hypothetical protein